MARKWIVGGAVLVMALTGCGVEVEEPRGNSENAVSDLAAMQQTWDVMPVETRAGLCAGWVEDKEAALDLFYASGVNADMDTMPAEFVVRAFFDQKCL